MPDDPWLARSASPVLAGLARNPAAPAGVLLRLLQHWPEQSCAGFTQRRELPPQVQEAMLRHESPRIRAALARHPDADPRLRAALLHDPEWKVTARAFGGPGQRPLSDDALIAILVRLDSLPPDGPFSGNELLDELRWAMKFDRRLFRLAARHPRPGLRRFAALSWGLLDGPVRQALLVDDDAEVRQTAADQFADEQRVMQPADLPSRHGHAFWSTLYRPLSRALVDQVVTGGDVEAISVVAGNPSTPPDVVEALLRHPEAAVRRSVAGRADLTAAQLALLAADPAIAVRTAVSVHPGLTEDQRAGIDIDLTTVDDLRAVGGDPLQWARSVNPLLRRHAARDPELPADLAARLADDTDAEVRLLLAQHHPAAPPELLLRSFLEYPGSRRGRILQQPRFPTDGLSRFADHADPEVRALVARDPHADPLVVDRLSTDPDAGVRKAMASCPRLPVPRIVALLDDPELAGCAAANASLPLDTMDLITDQGRTRP